MNFTNIFIYIVLLLDQYRNGQMIPGSVTSHNSTCFMTNHSVSGLIPLGEHAEMWPTCCDWWIVLKVLQRNPSEFENGLFYVVWRKKNANI